MQLLVEGRWGDYGDVWLPPADVPLVLQLLIEDGDARTGNGVADLVLVILVVFLSLDRKCS